jgi:cell division protease FtsH
LTYYGERPSTWLGDILSWVVPMLVFFGLWMFVVRSFARKQGLGDGLMAIGKSRAKVYVEKDTKVTFADVAGVDEAKDELKEIIEFLRDPKGYGRLERFPGRSNREGFPRRHESDSRFPLGQGGQS